MHSLEQDLMNLFAQRNVYNERLGHLSKIQNTISERNCAEERVKTHEKTIRSLQEQSMVCSDMLSKFQQQYRELKGDNGSLGDELEKTTLELKLIEDMAGKSVEDQEKTSRNLKQKLTESSQLKYRLETDVVKINTS